MALRAFHANPSLGGFGGESSGRLALSHTAHATEQDCDAFAQIVKELVDNAVDACQQQPSTTTTNVKRIRVVIEKMNSSTNDEEEEDYVDDANGILRVTVSDNGVGMENIQACVNAFQTTKAGNSNNNDNSESDEVENTAGRYGIGLTLCLLHAQRLVPNSCASITSATTDAPHFTRASYVVDKDTDSVLCVKQESLPKTSLDESGTAVSLLVPGGPTATRAWPRLAEYFARFHLSLGLQCGLQVLAPCLSSIPLFIRPASQRGSGGGGDTRPENSQSQQSNEEDDDAMWTDGLSDSSEQHANVPGAASASQQREENDESMSNSSNGPNNDNTTTLLQDARRLEILRAANAFLKRPIEINNVAHAVHPIGRTSRRNQDSQPTLQVDMIVYDDDDSDDEHGDLSSVVANDFMAESPSAKLMLVRMVNGVPLLDGAEATACGLVQGVVQKQSVWNMFGLKVSPATTDGGMPFDLVNDQSSVDSDDEAVESGMPGELFAPTYEVRDSDQVTPYIQSGVHDLFELEGNGQDDGSALSRDGASNRQTKNGFLPAHLRIGNILLVVQIHAKPSSLPLPTLSKGRLPMNNHPIGSALELGIMECLDSLQKTSPGLLLTTTQLKETIRDTRYIPALSAALALIVTKSRNAQLKTSMQQTIQRWSSQSDVARAQRDDNASRSGSQHDETGSRAGSIFQNNSMDSGPPAVVDVSSMENGDDTTEQEEEGDDDDDSVRVATLRPLLESRLRLVCAKKKKSRRRNAQNGDGDNDSDTDETVSLDEFLHVEPAPVNKSQVQEGPASSQETFSEKGLSVSSSSASGEEEAVVARNVSPDGGRRLDPNEDDFDDDSWF